MFLVELYDNKGRLLVEDELLEHRRGWRSWLLEGKRMRRENRELVCLLMRKTRMIRKKSIMKIMRLENFLVRDR